MEEKKVVNEEELTTPPVSEDIKTQPDKGNPEDVPKSELQAGDKTEPNLLLKSLQEERDKRKQLETEIVRLEEELQTKSSALSEEEVFSDEGKALQKQIDSFKSALSEVKGELVKKDLLANYSVLKDKWEELEEFRQNPENKGMSLRTAAKAFLVENGLLEPTRKGLEKTTGGQRTPITSGMTAEDIKTLRETNYKKYYELLRAGKIKIEE